MKTMIAAVMFSVLVGVSAWADPTKEDWAKLGQPIVDDFGACARSEVDRTVGTSMTAEAIADAAVTACEPKLAPLHAVLMGEPFNETSEGADEGVTMMKDEVRAAAVADVKQRRK